MEFHRGRLLDHVHLVVRDLDASRRFYAAVLEALGRDTRIASGNGYFFADELYVSEQPNAASHVHLAFQAEDQETVRRFHKVALQSGGRDNGAPGDRAYHPGYFAA